MIMKNTTYDNLKRFSLVVFPALITLYAAIASIWNLPYAVEIAGTLTAINTALGAILGISTNKYNERVTNG